MAQRALTTGGTVRRKRAVFGLLDADGWGWATLKAFVWLIIIIFILAYLPDRAYYATVNRTLDLGILAWSPVNLCPPENENLPCPVPVGAITPWHPSPAQLNLPQPRTDGAVVQIGTRLLYIGGSDGTTPKADVFAAPVVPVGNFDKWTAGPALPEPRANASVIFSGGSVYVLGGQGADGKPTTTAYVLTPNAQTGDLGQWKTDDTLKLPEARTGAAGAAASDGLLLLGGANASGPVKTTWKSKLDKNGKLTAWAPEADMYAPQMDGAAAVLGDFIWVWGGRDANGPVRLVQRGEFAAAAPAGQPANPNAGKVSRWAVNDPSMLPGPRTNAVQWSANGALYLVGGNDGSADKSELYWTVPDNKGNIAEWKHLDQSDLPSGGLEGGAAIINGPDAIIVGGRTTNGVLQSSVRSNIAPQAPFFQLGLVGATVPALKIEGEIGQQLGYLNAAGVGTVDFIVLLLIGWAFAHKEQTRLMFDRVRNRRRRNDPTAS
jgi:Kelch motif